MQRFGVLWLLGERLAIVRLSLGEPPGPVKLDAIGDGSVGVCLAGAVGVVGVDARPPGRCCAVAGRGRRC